MTGGPSRKNRPNPAVTLSGKAAAREYATLTDVDSYAVGQIEGVTTVVGKLLTCSRRAASSSGRLR
jgi:hypothetical protein